LRIPCVGQKADSQIDESRAPKSKEEQEMDRDNKAQLLMEREKIAPASVQQQGLKTILFHVNDDPSGIVRLEVALSLARASGAHLHCLHVSPIEAYTVVDVIGTFVNAGVAEALEDQATKLRAEIEGKLANEDVTWNYEQVTGVLMSQLVRRAALADLIITAREPSQPEFGGPAITLLGDLLRQSRTPLLVVPEDATEFDPLGPAVIAWNGSYEAANTVRWTVPLLALASEIRVVQFSEDKEDLVPATGLLEYLSRQNISAELDVRSAPPAGIAAGLIDYAQERRASTLLIGGYSHSRAGQFLFGGVTRSLLKSCPLPLVIAS
jgi:nucleotide-binding universal stress UspA family protein